jgi:hypothetical protein
VIHDEEGVDRWECAVIRPDPQNGSQETAKFMGFARVIRSDPPERIELPER